LAPGGAGAVIDAQKIFGGSDRRHRTDFSDFCPAGGRACLRTEREQPNLSGNFGDQRRRLFVADRIRIPTFRAGGGFGLLDRWKIFHPPIQRPGGKLFDLFFSDGLDAVFQRLGGE
jgi:hypothetical protein